MKALIHSTVPVLASLNLNETLAFYADKLGFVQIVELHDYAIVGRDGAEIHFSAGPPQGKIAPSGAASLRVVSERGGSKFYPCEDRHIAENTSCYVRTGNTQALYEEFKGRGVEVKPPEIRPWGMKELYVIDPHGNLLKFGELA
ncbi:VOC family protein [Polaromonas sp. P1-6]|nr:VOC family protein [Polaromonas sp. P1-6]